MTMNLRMLAIVAAAFCIQEQVPPFRSTTNAVSVDVAVFDGNRVVSNLGVSDFEVVTTRSGRRSRPSCHPADRFASCSIQREHLETRLARYVRTMNRGSRRARAARPVRIITFSNPSPNASLRHPPIRSYCSAAARTAAFFDAVALAMVTIPTPVAVKSPSSSARDGQHQPARQKTMLDAARTPTQSCTRHPASGRPPGLGGRCGRLAAHRRQPRTRARSAGR